MFRIKEDIYQCARVGISFETSIPNEIERAKKNILLTVHKIRMSSLGLAERKCIYPLCKSRKLIQFKS